jgi:peptide-methionine (S)-S-oxide reductase
MINSVATLARDLKTGSVDALNHTPGNGGKRGIRTLVTLSRKHAFQACALNHSAIFPLRAKSGAAGALIANTSWTASPVYFRIVHPYICRKESVPMFFRKASTMITKDGALPGRTTAIRTAETHFGSGRALKGPYPEGSKSVIFALGCYWGAERKFWSVPGVWVTAVGNCGGFTSNPTYEEVCSGETGHTESVLVIYDPKQVSLEHLLKVFWESHDPTQGMRQGNDVGTQYRSAIYWTEPAQEQVIRASVNSYQAQLKSAGYGAITTELGAAGPFYFAEGYHQQYLAKNPNGYCGLGGTGVTCPIGLEVAA